MKSICLSLLFLAVFQSGSAFPATRQVGLFDQLNPFNLVGRVPWDSLIKSNNGSDPQENILSDLFGLMKAESLKIASECMMPEQTQERVNLQSLSDLQKCMHISGVDLLQFAALPQNVIPKLGARFLMSCVMEKESPTDCVEKQLKKRVTQAAQKIKNDEQVGRNPLVAAYKTLAESRPVQSARSMLYNSLSVDRFFG